MRFAIPGDKSRHDKLVGLTPKLRAVAANSEKAVLQNAVADVTKPQMPDKFSKRIREAIQRILAVRSELIRRRGGFAKVGITIAFGG